MDIRYFFHKLNKISYFPRLSGWIFFLLFILISLLYNYHVILFIPPQSIHQWRQADCLSITMNYYQDDNPFFEPSVHFLGRDNTGKTISEFPLIYYMIGKIWKITGPHEYIYRLLVILLFFSGLFAVFRLFEEHLHDSIMGMAAGLILFASPVLAYYAGNFLMDIPAFSLALIALFYFFRWVQKPAPGFFVCFLLLFLFAGLLKISALMSFIAIIGLFVLEWFGLKLKEEGRIFRGPAFSYLLSFSLVLLIQTTWILYARSYNSEHNSGIFLTGVMPIWELSREKILLVLEYVHNHIKMDYFRKEAQILFVAMLAFILIFFRKNHKVLLYMTMLLSFGLLLFVLLFFQPLRDHDYYTINLFIVIPVVFLSFLHILRYRFAIIGYSLFKILFIFFLVWNIDFAAGRIQDRYHPQSWENKEFIEYNKDFTEIAPILDSIGIDQDAKVISLSDNSINISLYLMNRKGWTNYGIWSDTTGIHDRIEQGAGYLFIYKEETYDIHGIDKFLTEKMGRFGNIDIYKLNSQ